MRRRRPAETGCQHRRGAVRADHHREAASRSSTLREQGRSVVVSGSLHAEDRRGGRGDAHDDAGRGGRRAVDRVRERDEPAVGSRRGTHQGGRVAHSRLAPNSGASSGSCSSRAVLISVRRAAPLWGSRGPVPAVQQRHRRHQSAVLDRRPGGRATVIGCMIGLTAMAAHASSLMPALRVARAGVNDILKDEGRCQYRGCAWGPSAGFSSSWR